MALNVQQLINQQLGLTTWKTYNCVLERLRCFEDQRLITTHNETSEIENYDTPIFACKFSQKQGYEEYLALANEDGHVIVCNTEQNHTVHSQRIHNNAIFDIAWLTDSFKAITVSGDHTARLVNVASDLAVEQIFTGHNRSVKTVATHPSDGSVFATGGRDGSIRVWDTRCAMAANLVVNADRTIQNSHCKLLGSTTPSSSRRMGALTSNNCNLVTAANSVTGLVFQNPNTLISCSSGDGLIKVWDLRKTYTNYKSMISKFTIPYHGNTAKNGFSNLLIDSSGVKLYASCLDNTIYAYNIATYNKAPIMEYKGHQNGSFYVKSALSKDNLYLLSGSSDHNAYIWNLKDGLPILKLQGHTSEVTCVAWRPKGDITLVTCSDDVKHKIWRVKDQSEERVDYGRAEPFENVSNKFDSIRNKRKLNENTPVQRKLMKTINRKRTFSPESDSSNSPASKRSNRCLFEADNEDSKQLQNLDTISEENRENVHSEAQNEYVSSPTTGLPNFVIDGVAPHLHNSPQKRPDKDWLTKMRFERNLFRESCPAESDRNQKVPKLEETSKGSQSISSTPTSSRKRKNKKVSRCGSPDLRKYFRVTSNSILKDSQFSPKNLMMTNYCSRLEN